MTGHNFEKDTECEAWRSTECKTCLCVPQDEERLPAALELHQGVDAREAVQAAAGQLGDRSIIRSNYMITGGKAQNVKRLFVYLRTRRDSPRRLSSTRELTLGRPCRQRQASLGIEGLRLWDRYRMAR
jgi:hypothetical protein